MKKFINDIKLENSKFKKGIFLVGLLLFSLMPLYLIFHYSKPLLIDYLFYEDEPIVADLIILVSGDPQRMEKVAELYQAGFADKVLITNALERGATVNDAELFGIPRDSILTENKATSTYENALYTKEIMMEQGFDSALIVTSNYHMRRTKLAYERVFSDTDVSFTYIPYHFKAVTRDSWEEFDKLFKNEYIKLIGGYLFYW